MLWVKRDGGPEDNWLIPALSEIKSEKMSGQEPFFPVLTVDAESEPSACNCISETEAGEMFIRFLPCVRR